MDPRDLARGTDRWLTTVVHSLSGALAAFAQAALLQPQPVDAATARGAEHSPTCTVTVAAAADHLRHVARAAQQLTAALAVHLDEAPFMPRFYEANQDKDKEEATDPHAKLQPKDENEDEADRREETC